MKAKNNLLIAVSMAILAAAIVLVGCGSSPSASSTTSAQDELDMAIRDTSDYLNDNIPEGNKIVILNIQSDSPALSDYIIDELIANAVNDRIFSVVDRQQLDLIRAEQNFQYSGEVSDKSAQEIGQLLGAQTIVSGAVSALGERYRLRVRALEVQTAQVQGQYNRNMTTSPTINDLMTSGGGTSTKTAAASNSRPASSTIASGGVGDQTAQSAAPAQTPAPTVPAQNPFPVTGLWKVTGKDSANWEADLVIEEIERNRFSGYFDWYRSGTNYSGREYFRGTYDAKDRLVVMEGTRLVNPSGLALGIYQAFLSRTGLDFISGTWRGGGTWGAKWQE